MDSQGFPTRRYLVTMLACAMACLSLAAMAQDVSSRMTAVDGSDRISGFIVHLQAGTDASAWNARSAAAFSRAGVDHASLRHKRRLATGGELFSVGGAGLDTGSANRIMARLAGDPSVVHIEPDIRLRAYQANDPRWPQQWGHHDARTGSDVAVAWRRTRGAGSVVAVIDTGITEHEDLKGQTLPGYDFISNAVNARDGDGRDANPLDQGDWFAAGECDEPRAQPSSWHGSHVAGIVAARADNAIGIAGVAPAAKVVPVRVLGKCGGSLSDIAEAMVWAAGGKVQGVPDNPHPARVLNLSLGGIGACGRTMANAVRGARSLGATVVVAAGNESIDVARSTPANCPGVVAVAASGREGALAWYSNFGQGIALTAPGGTNNGVATKNIVSTVNAGRTVPTTATYAFYPGTSMAAPHVAGVAALMYALNPALTPDRVREYMVDTTRPMRVRCANACGTGLLDAGAAVDAVFAER
jgi:serine protease